MTVRSGINGFGRMGRLGLRAGCVDVAALVAESAGGMRE